MFTDRAVRVEQVLDTNEKVDKQERHIQMMLNQPF